MCLKTHSLSSCLERLLNLVYNYATVSVPRKTQATDELMDKIFQKIIDNNFSDLKGMVGDASIPMPQNLINEMIAATLVGSSIVFCQASIHPGNRVDVNVKTTLLPWALNVRLRLDKSVDFASFSSPKMRAWLENNRLLGSLGSFFSMLPEGIKLYGNQLVFDLGVFLQTPEQRRLLELVKSIDIRTEEEKLILDVKIEVD
jgi:hypothetical protein